MVVSLSCLNRRIRCQKKYSIEGWKVGLKHKLENEALKSKAEWLFEHTVDLKKGDQLSIVKNKSNLEMYKNEKLIGKTSDPVIMDLAFEPWLGEKPVDEELKSALLGKSAKSGK